MTREEKSLLEQLDQILRSGEVSAQILSIVERVRANLARKSEAVMAWEPIPLNVFGDALPAGIRSAWVFILRAGADTGAERHPNSHQRMMSFDGTGDLQTEKRKQTSNIERRTPNAQVREGKPDTHLEWQSNVLVSNSQAPLERRWVSIPPNVWHRPVVGQDADWVVVSFHTAPAEELIEERPDGDAGDEADEVSGQVESKKKTGAPGGRALPFDQYRGGGMRPADYRSRRTCTFEYFGCRG